MKMYSFYSKQKMDKIGVTFAPKLIVLIRSSARSLTIVKKPVIFLAVSGDDGFVRAQILSYSRCRETDFHKVGPYQFNRYVWKPSLPRNKMVSILIQFRLRLPRAQLTKIVTCF